MKYILILLIFLTSLDGCKPTEKNQDNEKVVLFAKRDAPISGIWLKLYKSNICEIGFYGRTKPNLGKYKIFNDTLFMNFPDTLPESMDSTMIFENDNLIYVNNKGALEIITNELK